MPPLPQLPKVINKLILALGLVSFAGFIDAAYLTIKWYVGGTLPCNIFKSCDLVTRSAYSDIAGIPISLLGALYYLTIIILVLFAFDRRNLRVLRIACWATIIGLITSLILLSIQAFILKAYCLYCIISAISSITLFVIGMYTLRISHRPPEVTQTASL